MARSVPSHASATMLKWARVRAGFDVNTVEQLEKIETGTLANWEMGEGTPSLAKLRSLATRYGRPLMVFYLKEPPKDFSIVKDFRQLPKDKKGEFSITLRKAIQVAQERQAWASGVLRDNGIPESPLVGSISVKDDPDEVGQSIVEILGASFEQLSSITNAPSAFRYWRRLAESNGIFVFQVSRVDVTEMRGFALPDPYAPTLVINSKDSYQARIFTLIHEIVHVMLNEPAVTGAGELSFKPDTRVVTEKFCNRVAGATLVPRTELSNNVPKQWKNVEEQALSTLSRRFWVSRAVVAFRMFECGFANREWLHNKLYDLKPSKRVPSEPAMIPQHTLTISRTGESFARFAVSAFQSGELHGGELTSLLGMSLRHLPKLESSLFSAQATGKSEG